MLPCTLPHVLGCACALPRPRPPHPPTTTTTTHTHTHTHTHTPHPPTPHTPHPTPPHTHQPPQLDVVHTYVVEAADGRITDLLSFYTLPSSVIGNEQYDSLKVHGDSAVQHGPFAGVLCCRCCSTLNPLRCPLPPHPTHAPPPPRPRPQAAYMFYTVPAQTPLPQLMNDALILAHATGHDVFNALDIFENQKILKGGRRGACGPGHARRDALAPRTIRPCPRHAAALKFGIGDGKLRYYLFNWRVARDIPASKVGLVML